MKDLNTVYPTGYVLKKYNITRQTLYNWEKAGLISPKRDWRGWRVWDSSTLLDIENLLSSKKIQKNNKTISNNQKLMINNRRYLGSKQKLIPFIKKVVSKECEDIKTFADIFAGTGVVAHEFNDINTKIIVNDILYSNYLAYITWFSDDYYDFKKISKLINEFNNMVVSKDNYVSRNFGGTYFTIENARKIGAIREEIESMTDITSREKAILITSLLYAMDKVANTCGHYDAYRKILDTTEPLYLQVPAIKKQEINKGNMIFNEDANKLVKRISSDLIYIDTPYNSRQYSDAYHLLENIARWEKPEVTGVARKMIDRSKIKSDYCTVKAPKVFKDLISNIDSKYILVSYNNMGQKGDGRSNAKISDEEIIDSLRKKGEIKVFYTDFQYFTAGKTQLKDHKERLFLCKCK